MNEDVAGGNATGRTTEPVGPFRGGEVLEDIEESLERIAGSLVHLERVCEVMASALERIAEGGIR
jgi:hypothetical protein